MIEPRFRAEWDACVAEIGVLDDKLRNLSRASRSNHTDEIDAMESEWDAARERLVDCACRIFVERPTSVPDIRLLADVCSVLCADSFREAIAAEALGALLKGIRDVLPAEGEPVAAVSQ